jgi:hypothetical protein
LAKLLYNVFLFITTVGKMTTEISQELLQNLKDIALRADSEIVRSKAINALGYLGQLAVPSLKEVSSLALTPEETSLAANWIVKIASGTFPEVSPPSAEEAEAILSEYRRPPAKEPTTYITYPPATAELKKDKISPGLEPARESIVKTVGTLADMIGLCLEVVRSPVAIFIECLSWIPALLEGL